ncbi:MAG: tRNA pseudouridine(38-40) synthase TruA [Balneolaceae bacterium]
MTRWKLILEYEGTDFSGWQKQPDQRTVQGELETALATLFQQSIVTMGQGRTDAGVHALAQIAHADLPPGIIVHKLLHAMRGLLPKDMAVIDAEPVSDDFHARFDAISRSYRYQISLKDNPLYRKVVWTVHQSLDVELLETCASMITGEHDFINFCIPPDQDEMTTISTIEKSVWTKDETLLVYHIEGNRFLRHLVRRLVGTMIWVGTGKLTLDQFELLLSGKEVKKKGHAAPSTGLILESVKY